MSRWKRLLPVNTKKQFTITVITDENNIGKLILTNTDTKEEKEIVVLTYDMMIEKVDEFITEKLY